MKKKYGLIGYPLSHSFSQKYFSEKFQQLKLNNCEYQNFELEKINEFEELIEHNPDIHGLNVTIPYKEEILPYLDLIDKSAEKVGAINVIKFENGKRIGFNSDYFGFKRSIENWIPSDVSKALVLGTGGASKAVCAVLKDIGIEFISISRTDGEGKISYETLKKKPKLVKQAHLIINTTPLGMSPKIDTAPDIDYKLITVKHYLFDLIYNPSETTFLKNGREKGANTLNGLEMLELQAEKSWEIWNQ